MLAGEEVLATGLIDAAVQHFLPADRRLIRILDVGCGAGGLVQNLAGLGYQASGCDLGAWWREDASAALDLRVIQRPPYRLPYDRNTFDVVCSTSVLEHAQNKKGLFREVHRVLAPNGVAIHLYPSKWYLPIEPHIYVPLVNVLWPDCPHWWLVFWAKSGIRNEFQREMHWRDVVAANERYCQIGLSYWSHRKYRRVSEGVFGNYLDATELFVKHGYGGFVEMCRRFHVPTTLAAAVTSRFRMSLLVNRKMS